MNYNKYTKMVFDKVKNESNLNIKLKTLSDISGKLKQTCKDIENFKIKLTKNLLKCPSCGKYFEPKTIETKSRTKLVKGVCVYTDCGYGDDDEYADVTYRVFYKNCPYCKKEVEIDRYEIKEINRRGRW